MRCLKINVSISYNSRDIPVLFLVNMLFFNNTELNMYDVSVKPKMRGIPSLVTKDSESIKISIRQFSKAQGDEGAEPVREYLIQVNRRSEQFETRVTVPHDDQKTDQVITIDKLEYNTHYVIRVVPVYDDGTERVIGIPSPEISVKTDCKGKL